MKKKNHIQNLLNKINKRRISIIFKNLENLFQHHELDLWYIFINKQLLH